MKQWVTEENFIKTRIVEKNVDFAKLDKSYCWEEIQKLEQYS